MKNKLTVILVSLASLILLSLIIFGAYVIMDGYGIFENYDGWRQVTIPTDTELQATVKLPDEWSFVDENGRLKIKDTSGSVIAEECYSEWRIDYYQNDVHYDNRTELDLNEELGSYWCELDNYESIKNASSGCHLYMADDGREKRYALRMFIMDIESKEGDYELFLVFNSRIDSEELFEKIQKSYVSGGIQEQGVNRAALESVLRKEWKTY